MQDKLPEQSLSGMINKFGSKVRLHFRTDLEQLWIGTKGMRLLLAIRTCSMTIVIKYREGIGIVSACHGQLSSFLFSLHVS